MMTLPLPLALLLFVGSASDPAVSTTYDVPYTNVGAVELRLDIVQPAVGDGPFPAVLVIHGGAWREGSKEENRRFLMDFARRGYVGVSPQYRFVPKDLFPAQVEDVKAAVRFLRQNAKSLKVDPDRIGAMGFSVGGYLALMLGLTGPEDGLDGAVPKGVPSARVSAVVDYFAPVDLADPAFSEQAKTYVKDYLGAAAAEKPQLAARASPVTYVSSGDAPVLVFHGTKDPLVPTSQALELARRLTTAGVPGRVELIVGAEHGWQGAEWDRTMKETFEFFDEKLKPRER